MPRVICDLPNASDEISGVKFHQLEDGRLISDELSDEQAGDFASIPGYELDEDAIEVVKAPEVEAPKLTNAQRKAAEKAAATAAAAEAAAAKVAAEKEAAEKAAADQAAADQAAAQLKAQRDAEEAKKAAGTGDDTKPEDEVF